MHALYLELENFRNIGRASVSFNEGINVIRGDNAQGKTNLLEAIYYLCGARSFRTRGDAAIIKHDESFARLCAGIWSAERQQKIEMTLRRGARRSVSVNGVKLKNTAELAEKMRCVLFCPDDLEIIRGGAAERRKFMDMAISQLRPRYCAALAEFNRLYEHKNRILRDWQEKPSLLEMLEDFNLRLCQVNADIIYHRAHFVRRINELAVPIHADFSGGRDELTLTYRSVSSIDDPQKKPAELLPMLLEHQKSHYEAELRTGSCLSGCHKDDLEVSINGKPARGFASQGQARTAALSLKLAERELHFADTGENPVLLLDDVLSELDEKRQDFVLNRISGGQVFITCCTDEKIRERTGGLVLSVENGEVRC